MQSPKVFQQELEMGRALSFREALVDAERCVAWDGDAQTM